MKKILEIILSVIFLMACLIYYKAVSMVPNPSHEHMALMTSVITTGALIGVFGLAIYSKKN